MVCATAARGMRQSGQCACASQGLRANVASCERRPTDPDLRVARDGQDDTRYAARRGPGRHASHEDEWLWALGSIPWDAADPGEGGTSTLAARPRVPAPWPERGPGFRALGSGSNVTRCVPWHVALVSASSCTTSTCLPRNSGDGSMHGTRSRPGTAHPIRRTDLDGWIRHLPRARCCRAGVVRPRHRSEPAVDGALAPSIKCEGR